jgi:hypothetical protein
MDKLLIFGLFRHFDTEVNPEMIPNLSRRAAESLKKFQDFYSRFLFLDSRWPAETGWFISGLFLSMIS